MNTSNYYSPYNLRALQYAMNDLKGEKFKFWAYLGKNQDGYTFSLSPVDAKNWGFSKSTYDRAVEELIEKGYLVEREPGSDDYDFYEIPKAVEKEIRITIHKMDAEI